MTAVQQIEAHHHAARLNQRVIDGIVGGRAGKRLHVHVQVVCLDAVGGEGLGGARRASASTTSAYSVPL